MEVSQQQHSKSLRWLDSKGSVPLALSFTQLGYAVYFIISKVALSNGTNRFVFAVYRDIIGLLFLAPFAYFSERYVTLSSGFLMPMYRLRNAGHVIRMVFLLLPLLLLIGITY